MSNINVSYQNLFVHVPKTAGTSMEEYPFVGGSGHENLHHLAQKPEYNPDFFHWSFVRNPYERLVSAYFYINKKHGKGPENLLVDPDGTFESFVFNLENSLPANPYNNEEEFMGYDPHIFPQFYFINSPLVSKIFVGRYEKLNHHWRSVVIKIHMGFPMSQQALKLPHRNKTFLSRPNIKSLYTPEMSRKVYDIYYGDFQTLGYEKWIP